MGVCLLTGCPTPNSYTTPRTLPPGEIQQTFSFDTWGQNVPRNTRRDKDAVVLPTIPTYTLRYGASERVEVAGRLSNASMLGLELKLQLARGRVDLAILPRIEATGFPSSSNSSRTNAVAYLYGPMLLGVNVSEEVTLLGGVGVVYGAGGIDRSSGDKQASFYVPVGGMASFSFGLDIRTGKGFSVQPEVTVLRHLGEEALFTMAGLGFTFGHAISYADVR